MIFKKILETICSITFAISIAGCKTVNTTDDSKLIEKYKEVLKDGFSILLDLSENLKNKSKLTTDRVEHFFDKIYELAEDGMKRINEKKDYPKDMAPIIEEMELDK